MKLTLVNTSRRHDVCSMKGALSPFTLLIILIMVAVGIFISMVLLGRVAAFNLSDYVKFNFSSEDTEGWQWVASLGNLPVVKVTEDGQILTSSSVACAMADDIYVDFVSNLDSDHGESLPFTEQTLIGWKVFQIPYKYTKKGLPDRPYNWLDLDWRQQGALTNAGCRQCNLFLDQRCLDAHLALKKVQDASFCGSWRKFIGGRLMEGSFCNPSSADYDPNEEGPYKLTADPTTRCCVLPAYGEADRISEWKADVTSDPFTSNDGAVTANAYPPAVSNPLYVYLILWNPQKYDEYGRITVLGTYDINILTIPRLNQLKINTRWLSTDITDKLQRHYRNHPAGAEIAEIRRIADVNYTLLGSLGFSDFIRQINDTVGVASINSCDSLNDCMEKAAEKTVEYRRLSFQAETMRDWVFNDGGDFIGLGSTLGYYNIFSNLDPDQPMEGSVRIILDNWRLDDKKNDYASAVACINGNTSALVGLKRDMGADPIQNVVWDLLTKPISEWETNQKNWVKSFTGCDPDKVQIYKLTSEQGGAMGHNIIIWSEPTD